MRKQSSKLFVWIFLTGVVICFIGVAVVFTVINNQTSAKRVKVLGNGAVINAYTNPLGDITLKYEINGAATRLFAYSPNSLNESLESVEFDEPTGLLTFTVMRLDEPNGEPRVEQFRLKPNENMIENTKKTQVPGVPVKPKGYTSKPANNTENTP